MATTVVIQSSDTTQVISDDEVIGITLEECKDFDLASSMIKDILEDGDLNGPLQFQLVQLIAQNFLDGNDIPADFDCNYVLYMGGA
jgi:hypothetical protein